MSRRKYWIGTVFGFFGIIAAAAAFAMAFPAPTACVAIAAYDFEEMSEQFFVPPNSGPTQRARYETLVLEGRERIKDAFGEPEADPIIVFFDDPRSFTPLFLNEVGQGPSIGSHDCLIIGPRGQNVDVVSHELMHSEILHRAGAWKSFREIPAWFNEGVAMQVDFRERFIIPPDDLPDTSYVRALNSSNAFFAGENSYAAARHEVMDLLNKHPAKRLYANLERVRNGETFAKVFE
jgi:hypothetical protein